MMLADIADLVSLLVPFALLFCFFYSKDQDLRIEYFNELPGKYGGFTTPLNGDNQVHAGVILTILNINSSGYFQGEIRFGENLTSVVDNKVLMFQQLREAICPCVGTITHTIYTSTTRNPIKPSENRLYYGKLFVVDRFDYDFENYNFDNYIQQEFHIIHYREMKVLKLTRVKVNRTLIELPAEATVFKQTGVTFDLPESVLHSAFRGTRLG